jgi:hypothetical protein
METKTICPNCGQPIQDGGLVTGESWNGQGGQHVHCPEKAEAANG